MAKLASTDIYGNIVIKGLTTTKATASSSAATQIPVFISSPASTEQQLVTRTPAQLLSDIGAYAASNPSGYTTNTGTVTSVSGTGTVSGLSLSGTVTTTGNITLGGTLSVTASNFASQTANTFLAAPNGSAGTPTFRTIAVADIPILNQNTTGTASNVTGIVAAANGGTGVNNGARTLTINTNAGTISFTNASTTLTVANTASVSGTNTGDQTVGDATLTIANGTGISLSATPTFTANATSNKTITITNSAPHVATNLTWTAGTTAGPTVNSSTGTGAAIPSASGTASGVVTTTTQTFAGEKTFTSAPIIGSGTQMWQIDGTGSTLYIKSGTGSGTNRLLLTNTSTPTSSTFLRGDGTWATPTYDNYYPTTFAWTGGTTSGPTGSLTGSGMSAVSFAAIPSANGTTASGIVTTGTQTFGGAKTFSSSVTISAASGALTFSGATANSLSFAAGTSTINAATTGADRTLNLFTQATASPYIKTINIGTNSASGSTTTINIGSTTGTTTTIMGANLDYVTSAPSAANTGGLKIAVLSTDPGTKYSGWLYFITA